MTKVPCPLDVYRGRQREREREVRGASRSSESENETTVNPAHSWNANKKIESGTRHIESTSKLALTFQTEFH
jgi:hypothetical protein